MIAVVDASVAVKWVIPEVLSEHAERLTAGGDELLAPDLLQIEVANALWKKTMRRELSPREADEALALVLGSGIVLRPTGPLVPRAVAMARGLRHPVYDCVYLALAEHEHVTFVTADDTLARRATRSRLGVAVTPLRAV